MFIPPHKRLFIPGPSEVRWENLLAMATPQIGHRAKEFEELYGRIWPKLQQLLYTQQRVIMVTSSSTGCMEMAVRCCSNKKVLSCVNGAFADRWYKIAVGNGKAADKLQFEWGHPVYPDVIDKHLATGQYDAISVVFNETSVGVRSPMDEIAEVMKKYPDVLFLVDAVSGMAGDKIEVDRLGIDCCLAGVQKCFALPAGFAVMSVSDKAFAKAKTVENRGFYFDLLDYEKFHAKNQTSSTPSIAHLYALDAQMEYILNIEGLDSRWARHKKMAGIVQEWALKYFDLFPVKREYCSNTLTTITNTRSIDVSALNKELAKRGVGISNGYGDFKDKTFRIAHMGDVRVAEVVEVLGWIEDILNLK